MKKEEICEVCYTIICKRCQWKADQEATEKIQKGEITACPECGWSPSDIL